MKEPARKENGASQSGFPGASEEMFALLVSQVKDYAIFALDPEGRVATWNEGAARIKGYTADEVLGRHFSAFYPESDKAAGKPDWELEIAIREGRFEDVGWRVRNDGTMFWANVVITPLWDEARRLKGFAKVTRDITGQREKEQKREQTQREEADTLRALARRAAELERVKSDFLNLASHELRGPVALVRGYVSMMEEGDLDIDAVREIAPVLSGRLAQMELMIKQMLETARLEQGRLDLQPTEFDLREVVSDQVADLAPLATRTPLALELPRESVIVMADRMRIATVIANLLDNAIKYSPDGGGIRIFLSTRNGRAFVSVSDRGVGIEPRDLDKLFQRFVRLDTETNKAVGGTGLGLFLAREIARRHGGDILVESRPGQGSNFTLALPSGPSPLGSERELTAPTLLR